MTVSRVTVSAVVIIMLVVAVVVNVTGVTANNQV